jgi:hypothetical protein
MENFKNQVLLQNANKNVLHAGFKFFENPGMLHLVPRYFNFCSQIFVIFVPGFCSRIFFNFRS